MMSGAMSLPMSSFPNVNSLLVEDDYKTPYLHAQDFILHGTAISIMVFLLLNSVAYLLILAVFWPTA